MPTLLVSYPVLGVYVDELSASLRANQSARMQAQAEASELQSQLQQYEAELRATQGQLDHVTSSHQHMSRELSATQSALSQLQADHHGAEQTAAQVNTLVPALQHKVQMRDHVFSLVWSELVNMQASLAAMKHTLGDSLQPLSGSPGVGNAGARRKPAGLISMLQEDAGGIGTDLGHGEAGILEPTLDTTLDLSDPAAQQRATNAMSRVRVQVSGLVAQLLHCRQALEEHTHAAARYKEEQAACMTRLLAEHGVSVSGIKEELGAQVAALQREREELRSRLEDAEDVAAEVKQRMSALQGSYASLDDSVSQLEADKAKANQEVLELTASLRTAEAAQKAAESLLANVQSDLEDALQRREASKAQVEGLEAQLVTLRSELATVKAAAAGDSTARQRAELEASSQAARVGQLEALVADLKQQVSSGGARLSATEKALMDATSRNSELSSKLALAETDARIKVQELGAKLSAADSAKAVAMALHAETQERLTHLLKAAEGQEEGLKEELKAAQADRRKAMEQVDVCERQLREAQVQAQDAAFVHRQLHAVMAERDTLTDELRQTRHAQSSAAAAASHECSTLRQELKSVRGELQQTASERLHLAAQLEVAKLGSVVSSALARSKAASGAARSPGGDASTLTSPLPAADLLRQPVPLSQHLRSYGLKASESSTPLAFGLSSPSFQAQGQLYTTSSRAGVTHSHSSFNTPTPAWKPPTSPYGAATSPLGTVLGTPASAYRHS